MGPILEDNLLRSPTTGEYPMNNPVAPEIEFEDLVTVEVPCSINGTYKVAFHTAAFAAWLAGASLEDAFPDTDALHRTVLVGGPTPAEAEAEAQSKSEERGEGEACGRQVRSRGGPDN